MSVAYVTSFTRDMYEATGIHLVTSFFDTKSDGVLVACHEGAVDHWPKHAPHRLELYDLGQSEFLMEWLQRNRDIIPVSLGGIAESCRCGTDRNGHEPWCVFHWFNRNASRWFRKIVALDYAGCHVSCDALVWVDSDCRFTRRLPSSVIAALFGDASVLYHKSPDRRVLDSGVIAFKRDPGGRKVLSATVERFRTGAFRRDTRWDDGYQFQKAIESCADVTCEDLARSASSKDGTGHVLPSSPLGAYIEHLKGIHFRTGLMV